MADKKLVEDCYFDLLIDDQSLVRSTTLRVLSNLRIEGWVSLHARSLNDDDYNIQRAAMDGLLGDRKEGVPVLLEFVRKYPAEKLAHWPDENFKIWELNHEAFFEHLFIFLFVVLDVSHIYTPNPGQTLKPFESCSCVEMAFRE